MDWQFGTGLIENPPGALGRLRVSTFDSADRLFLDLETRLIGTSAGLIYFSCYLSILVLLMHRYSSNSPILYTPDSISATKCCSTRLNRDTCSPKSHSWRAGSMTCGPSSTPLNIPVLLHLTPTRRRHGLFPQVNTSPLATC